MKKATLAFLLLVGSIALHAQKISLISLTNYGAKESIYIETPDKILIVLSKDGNIQEYGTDYGSSMYGYWPGRLNKYMGRVDNYTANDNESFRGKVKYIGQNMITYYGSYDEAAMQGKVRSIGSVQIDYYQSFEDVAYKGNIKTISGTAFTWYSNFDNESMRGRLKSIGNTQFTWYSSFDDKATSGKVKSIDNNSFVYYTSFENNYGQKGQLKSGFATRYINGINYYVRN